MTEVEAAAQTWRPTWRTVVQMVVGFGLSAVILIWGLPHFAKTSWGEVWAIVSRLSWRQSAGFAVLALLGLWSYTFTLTASIPGLSHLRAFIVNTAGSAVSNVLPGGGAVGLAATFAICRSWGFGKRVVSTSAIVTGVWNTLARMLLPIIAIAGLAVGSSHLPPLMRDAAVAAVVSGVVIVALFVAVIASAHAAATVGQGLDRMLRPLTRRAKRSMSVEALTRDLRGRIVDTVRTGWFGLTIGLVGYFGFYYLLFLPVMKAAGVDLPLGQLFAAFAIGRLLTSVGVTPGGVGVTETGTAAALVAWGAVPAEATAGVVLFSIFTHLMEVPVGKQTVIGYPPNPSTRRFGRLSGCGFPMQSAGKPPKPWGWAADWGGRARASAPGRSARQRPAVTSRRTWRVRASSAKVSSSTSGTNAPPVARGTAYDKRASAKAGLLGRIGPWR